MTTLLHFILTYLVNALWQAPLLFAAAWLAVRICRRLGPAVEHRIWCATLFLQVFLPACSINLTSIIERVFTRASSPSIANITIHTSAAYAHSVLHISPALLAAILIAYACITAYFAARIAYGLKQAHILCRNANLLAAGTPTSQEWQRIRDHFHLHRVQIASSETIAGPITIGIVKRLLLLPERYLHAVSEEDIATAIAHECAHMRRHDFAKNLAYEIISLPLAWYPPLRITRAHLAETREMLCDELAATTLTGRHAYARSLLRLASLFSPSSHRPALHAIGIFDANNLERRITHMTHEHTPTRIVRKLILAASGLALGLGTCAFALALHTNVAPPAMRADAMHASIPSRVMAGQVISRVNPVYPPAAKKAKIQGKVVLEALIGKDGSIKNLRAISGPPQLLHSALDAVRQWKYKPYLLHGNPTEVKTEISINYSLK